MSASPAALSQVIQKLLEDRQTHADAMAEIDSTLERVGLALGSAAPRRRGRPAGASKKQVSPLATAPSAVKDAAPAGTGKRRRRRRSKFATSADESVLAFVASSKNPTTQDVKKHWLSEGRGGTADNALTKLVKENRLKRIPLGEGIRGSRYMIP